MDLGFIRRGRARILSPLDGRSYPIAWSVSTRPAKLLPISFVQCRMSGLGVEAFGFGDSLFFKGSLTQAFAEAWERLWLRALQARPSVRAEGPRNSSGLACGATAQEARARAAGELIERAVLLKAWQERLGWQALPVFGLKNRMLHAVLSRRGWRLSAYRLLEPRLGSVICCLGLRGPGGILFDSAYCPPRAKPADALAKVLRSLLRAALASDGKMRGFRELPERGGPCAHAEFYAKEENLAAFEFLGRDQRAAPVVLGRYDATQAEVLVDVPGFPFVAAASNPFWPRLSWGRESVGSSGNPWPHPLA